NGIVGAAYTWQFGGGLSATLSLEDNSQGNSGRARSTINLGPGGLGVGAGGLGVGAFTGQTVDAKGPEFLDPVFNMRLDQAWGFVGVSAALHDASGGYYGATEGTGHPSDKFGYAVSPAFLWNSPFGLTGDAIAAQGVWSKGAAGYATPLFGPTAVFGAGTSLG